jgi:hypothetical protein
MLGTCAGRVPWVDGDALTARPTDMTDEERAFVASYLTLMTPDTPQPIYDPREIFDALRW